MVCVDTTSLQPGSDRVLGGYLPEQAGSTRIPSSQLSRFRYLTRRVTHDERGEHGAHEDLAQQKRDARYASKTTAPHKRPVHKIHKDMDMRRDMGMLEGSRIQFRPIRLQQNAALPRTPTRRPRMRSIEVFSLFHLPLIQHCDTLKVAALRVNADSISARAEFVNVHGMHVD
jgi:hypothetical protein